jgi:HAD superfamily hydrolase (TIGR01490 family)
MTIMGEPRAAFFDTDETVISAKSMFTFLRYWLVRQHHDEAAFDAAVAPILAEAARGVHRSEINRQFYRLLAGVPYPDLAAAGREWFEEYREGPDAFVGPVLAAMARHRAEGATIVLVSGSFRACLDPIAEEVGADLVLCTEPILDDQERLTGEVVLPMIGTHKGVAVAATIKSLGLDVANCIGYGDHSSDLELLRAVGRPTVVGADPVLLAEAARNDWPVIPNDPAPRPTVAVPMRTRWQDQVNMRSRRGKNDL